MSAAPPPAAPASPTDAPPLRRVDDALWADLPPLVVSHQPREQPGRPRHDHRALCDGLRWLARTGSQ